MATLIGVTTWGINRIVNAISGSNVSVVAVYNVFTSGSIVTSGSSNQITSWVDARLGGGHMPSSNLTTSIAQMPHYNTSSYNVYNTRNANPNGLSLYSTNPQPFFNVSNSMALVYFGQVTGSNLVSGIAAVELEDTDSENSLLRIGISAQTPGTTAICTRAGSNKPFMVSSASAGTIYRTVVASYDSVNLVQNVDIPGTARITSGGLTANPSSNCSLSVFARSSGQGTTGNPGGCRGRYGCARQ